MLAIKINRHNVRTPARSIASNEFIESGKQLKDVLRKTVKSLGQKGIGAVSESGLFPMEIGRLPETISVASLKPLAIQAGLGKMGHHRMVIHPTFGAFVYLGVIFIDREISAYNRPTDYNPCLECKLCVSVCPSGAIASDGHFDFPSCYAHNYRDKLGGFSDWVDKIVQSKNVIDYRSKVSDAETLSMWQSLGYEANTKCDYCMAVCPAGDEVVGSYLLDKKKFLGNIVKPLQQKEEDIYVVSSSDAEAHVSHRFPHKTIRRIGNGLRARTITGFLSVLPKLFQRNQSDGLSATYHFTFKGKETIKATISIKDKKIEVLEGHIGKSNIRIFANSSAWIKFLAKEMSIVTALLTLKIRVIGNPQYLLAFGKCFPS